MHSVRHASIHTCLTCHIHAAIQKFSRYAMQCSKSPYQTLLSCSYQISDLWTMMCCSLVFVVVALFGSVSSLQNLRMASHSRRPNSRWRCSFNEPVPLLLLLLHILLFPTNLCGRISRPVSGSFLLPSCCPKKHSLTRRHTGLGHHIPCQ